jgi:type VI secretion system protein ImpH
MGAEGRLEDVAVRQPDLEAQLSRDPTSFGFFQAVRLLERLHPDREPVGMFGDPANEVARFVVHNSLATPASEIQALDVAEDDPSTMTVNFMGLTGPLGVLPLHYTLLVGERIRARDRALRDFLDLFHHRMISLFYRGWEKHHLTVGYERDRKDRLTGHVADLIGLPPNVSEASLGLPPETLLFYAGLLGPQQRSALALQELLQDHFGVPVGVEQFVGAWFPVVRSDRRGLTEDESEDPAGRLGIGTLVGDEVWDQQSRIRIRLGPLSRTRYNEFLPGGSDHDTLRRLARFFGGDGFEFEAQLVLARADVPSCVLGGDDPTPLAWSTWVRTAPLDHDVDDTIFTL